MSVYWLAYRYLEWFLVTIPCKGLHWHGYKVSAIVERLVLEDGIIILKQGLRQFLKRYDLYRTIARKPGSGLPSKLSPAVQQIIMLCARMTRLPLRSYKPSSLRMISMSLWQQCCITGKTFAGFIFIVDLRTFN